MRKLAREAVIFALLGNAGLDEGEKFSVDLGLAGAEAIGCSVPTGKLVPEWF